MPKRFERIGGRGYQTEEGHDENPIVDEHEAYLKNRAQEKARKAREEAFKEAKVESDKIAENASSSALVSQYGISMSEEQAKADFAETDPSPPPGSVDYPDAVTRHILKNEPVYARVDTEENFQTLDTEDVSAVRSDVPAPRAVSQIGDAVNLYESPFAGVESSISSVGGQLETEARLETAEFSWEDHMIREREFDPDKRVFVLEDYGTLDFEDFTPETEISSYVAPRISRGKDQLLAETQNLDFEDYPEVRADVDAPIGVQMLGAAILGGGYGFFRTVTMPVRPVAISETVLGTAELISGQTDLSNVENPLFALGTMGGSVVGGLVLGKLYSFGKGKYDVWQQGKSQAAIPDELFYLDDLTHDPVFPEPYEYQKVIRYKEDVLVADKLGDGFLASKKYDPPGRSYPKSGTGGMGYRRTGEGLIQDFIPEGAGHLETWTKYRMQWDTAHLAGVRVAPRFSPFISASGLSGTGAILGLVSRVGSIHDSDRGLSIVDVTPTLDNPSGSKSEGILDERVTGASSQLFDVVNINDLLVDLDPLTDLGIGFGAITRTDPIIEDVEDTFLDEDVIQDTTQDQDQKQRQRQTPILNQIYDQKDQKQKLPPSTPNPFSSSKITPRPQVTRDRRRRKKKKKRESPPSVGFELRSYKYRTPAEILGASIAKNPMGGGRANKIKNPFGGRKKKKKRSLF